MMPGKLSKSFQPVWMKSLAVALAATTLLVGGVAHGQSTFQGYSTTFDEGAGRYPFPRSSLSGQDNWDTNDAFVFSNATETVGQSDYVGQVAGYTGSSATNFQGALGGLFHNSTPSELPGSAVVSLYHGFTPGNAATYSLSTNFDISSSTAPSATRDSFGFKFQTAATANLFGVNFTPDATGVGNSANQMVIGYTVGGTTVTSGQAVLYNGIYTLNLSVNVTAKTLAINVTGGTGTTVYSATNISLASVDLTTVAQAAATWNLANTTGRDANGGYTNAGSNALIFDNFAVVPEPSTWMLLGVGALCLAVYARRHRAQA